VLYPAGQLAHLHKLFIPKQEMQVYKIISKNNKIHIKKSGVKNQFGTTEGVALASRKFQTFGKFRPKVFFAIRRNFAFMVGFFSNCAILCSMSKPDKKLFLLDAIRVDLSCPFRIHQNPKNKFKGHECFRAFGFTNTLLEVLQKQKPTHIGVAFDTAARTVRDEIFKDYKATRQEIPRRRSLWNSESERDYQSI
jgi:hypothetical protein